MEKNNLKGSIFLFMTALIWGSSFVAQSLGMEKIEAFTFNGIRTLMGSMALLSFIVIRQFVTKGSLKGLFTGSEIKKSAVLGSVFVFASNFQQYAFYWSTAGKIAFITALYLFFVPLLGLVIGKRATLITWFCVAAGIVGLYLLCITEEGFGSINKGDVMALICAFFFAVHILLIDGLTKDEDGIKISCLQFLFAGTVTIILMFIFESPDIGAIKSVYSPLLYAGIVTCGLAYTFQIVGQKYTSPTLASLIMCMESVFAVLAAALILHEKLTPRESVGCVIMFAAIIVSQAAEAKASSKKAKSCNSDTTATP